MVIEAEKVHVNKVVGTRPIRPDGADKVTGRARFGADIELPALLHGRVLRSPHAHARIRSIDTSKAVALPGVKAVLTSADLVPIPNAVIELGEAQMDINSLRKNVLAVDKALYRGHAVAAVAATSPHIAEEALGLIKVDYEPLPPVLTLPEAIRPGATILHEDMRTASVAARFGPAQGQGTEPTNIASHLHLEAGDIEKGFAEADVVVEREFTTKMVHQGYIEPHNATALWNPDGNLTVWTSTQGAFMVRDQLAGLLGLPVHNVKVVPMEIGGGFGAKIVVYLAPLAALMSRKTGRPVKFVMSRTEVFEATGPTSGTQIKVKMGATKDGRLVAAKAEMYYEAGAFPGSPVGAGAMTMLSPYDIPNVVVDGYDVVLNKPKVAAYRAPGAPAAAFAAEGLIDELAERLGLDPMELRLRNASKEGTRQLTGRAFPRIGNEEVMQAVVNSDHYRAPLEGPNRGRGVAAGFWFNAGMQSSMTASVNSDGTVNLIEGSTDIGGSRASLAMQLAESLELPMEAIKPMVVDTDSVGYNAVTGGSRTTFASGWAAYEVGQDIRRQMIERAAVIWGVQHDEVAYKDGVFFVPGGQEPHEFEPIQKVQGDGTEKRLTFAELAKRLNHTGGPVLGRSSVSPQGVGAAFAAHIVDVEVDPETGKVDILRYTAVQDAGAAVHPSYVEGQMQGGVAQGIGWALNEEYYYDDDGRMLNSSFLDYRMPTALDLPLIDTIIVEVPNPGHPYGVRGVGEVPIVPPLAAVANAVYRATGVRFRDLPMSPGRILEETGGLG